MLLRIGKKLLDKKELRGLKKKLKFASVMTDEFITKTARKEIKPGSRILDVGAGVLKYKKHFQDCKYLTQDLKQCGEIDYISDITEIPVEDQSFDVIICTEVLEHVLRPDLAIKEFSRILKSGGRLYLTAPFLVGTHRPPRHYYAGFSEFWYKENLNKYNFKNITVILKKGFLSFYSQETFRVLILLLKSKKWWHKLYVPFFLLIILVIYPLEKTNLDKYNPNYIATQGYLVKAEK